MVDIHVISLAMPFKLGQVNCYLVETGGGFFLIDSGAPNNRAALEAALAGAGCKPGQLKLVVLTHGDFDHSGNCAYLREAFGALIAMHAEDRAMVERGDMFSNRRKGNRFLSKLVALFVGFGKAERFMPDFYLDDGDSLAEYGLGARVLSLPGHSGGSIAVLTDGGELFCGDLLENVKGPALGSIMDDPDTARVQVERLRGLGVTTVYPGHGKPFQMEELVQ